MKRILGLCAALLLLLTLVPGASRPAAAAEPTDAVPDEVVITLKPGYRLGSNGAYYHGATAIRGGLNLASLRGIEALDSRNHSFLLRLAPGSGAANAIPALLRQPGVDAAERNHVYSSLGKPDDSIYSQQWGMRKINAEAAWDVTTGSPIVIAIIDTGVASDHPDLEGRVLPGFNAIRNNNEAYDDEGHGTHMAGVAAAAGNNGRGVAGMCWNCQILPIKVLNSNGQGSSASIIRGMNWAADNGAKIFSMSLGSDQRSRGEEDAVNYAYNKGITIFASSGNSGGDKNPVIYPAAYPNVIAIAATAPNDSATGFSSFGDFVDLAAPGVGIWSTYWNDEDGNTYAPENGTSPACPHAAGLAALALTLWPELSPAQIEQLLVGSSVDIGAPGKDVYAGWGRIDALKTVQNAAARNLPGAPTPPAPPAPPAPVPPQPGNNPAFVPIGPPPLPTDAGVSYFPETGHTVRGEFKNYWERNGGLAVFGFPLSEEHTEQTAEGAFLVQYFERQRFEFHPEKAAPYNVLLGRLGDSVLRDGNRDWFTFPKGAPQNGCRFFQETQHTVCGDFLKYWEANGLADPRLDRAARSLQLFGFPLSEPQMETNANGDTVLTQWFERGRFELHQGKGVLLGLLGKEFAANRGWR